MRGFRVLMSRNTVCVFVVNSGASLLMLSRTSSALGAMSVKRCKSTSAFGPSSFIFLKDASASGTRSMSDGKILSMCFFFKFYTKFFLKKIKKSYITYTISCEVGL